MRDIGINDDALHIVYPDKRVFAFSPNSCTITGVAPNQEVVITWAYGSLKRYTDQNNQVVFPLMYIFQSFFNLDFRYVESLGFENTSSQLISVNKTITVAIGLDIGILDFDIIYGALQLAKRERVADNLYYFNGYPLTLTQNIGNIAIDNDGLIDGNYFGKEIMLHNALNISSLINRVEFKTDSVTEKVFNIIKKDSFNCPSVYLRWTNDIGNYSYFLFKKSDVSVESKVDSKIDIALMSLEIEGNLFKKSSKFIERSGFEVLTVGLPILTFDEQVYLSTLPSSQNVFMLIDKDANGLGNWLEVDVKMNPIVLDYQYQQNKDIEFQVVINNLYFQHA